MSKSLISVTKIFILTTILILSFSVNSQNQKKKETPYIGFGTDTKMVKIGVIGSELYYSLSEMIASDSTFIKKPFYVASALNHFDKNGDLFDVIKNPKKYKTDFLKRYAFEEGLEWDQFQSRISDFEIPDFSQLKKPVIENGNIIFYANHLGLDTPYKVTGTIKSKKPLIYNPL